MIYLIVTLTLFVLLVLLVGWSLLRIAAWADRSDDPPAENPPHD